MRTAFALVVAAALLTGTGCRTTTVRGPEGESLTATTPRTVTIKRGETVPVEIGIDQRNFTGPVTVSISQRPSGVQTDTESQKVETTTATFMLSASKSASLVTDRAEDAMARQLLAGKYQGWAPGQQLSEWARTALVVAVRPD